MPEAVAGMLQVAALRRRLNLLYTLQFTMLLLVFVLGVYKFQ
ncbi:hypothetical protein [Chitinophaga japonensis]|uniref:Uncharacterized protein n=1 Tax=Chitinophaga japonensis TaxID=104662 RepID=A0A562SYZ0_CHIJA|nr:hypothetical protein [Chitinophaga japonensis]TWI86492.1 hypothetical protein LX66_3750 [Chitinophaga japonensis]